MNPSVEGKDIVDMMAAGIEGFVKDHLLTTIVDRLVSEFKEEITDIVNEQLSQMVFNAYVGENPHKMRRELRLIIEWIKTTKEYQTKYTVQEERVEKGE